MRVLLAEDDELLGDGTRAGLACYGYTVDWLKKGTEVLQAVKIENFDIIVLDLGLPELSGLDVLEQVRALGIKTPVLILTARDAIEDRVKGLDSGADDYLTKPFDLDELCARIRALTRRSVSRASPNITYGPITLDPASHIVTVSGNPINLPRREFALLQKLLENSGHVLSRELLTQSLYGWDDDVDSNALEVHIHNLRKKLGGNFIRTVRGVGYMAEKQDDSINT